MFGIQWDSPQSCSFICVQVYSDLPPLHIGDTVRIISDDGKLAQIYSLKEELGQYISMVRTMSLQN